MMVVQNRKEWRHEIVLALIESGSKTTDIVAEAKMIEEYIFQDDFVVEVSDPKQREALKSFIESLQSKG